MTPRGCLFTGPTPPTCTTGNDHTPHLPTFPYSPHIIGLWVARNTAFSAKDPLSKNSASLRAECYTAVTPSAARRTRLMARGGVDVGSEYDQLVTSQAVRWRSFIKKYWQVEEEAGEPPAFTAHCAVPTTSGSEVRAARMQNDGWKNGNARLHWERYVVGSSRLCGAHEFLLQAAASFSLAHIAASDTCDAAVCNPLRTP